jgi:hypothetical protein
LIVWLRFPIRQQYQSPDCLSQPIFDAHPDLRRTELASYACKDVAIVSGELLCKLTVIVKKVLEDSRATRAETLFG